MTREEAGQLGATLQGMHDTLTDIRAWLLNQNLERGLMRLPAQTMHATHKLDEMLLAIRKYASAPDNDPWWQARGYDSYEEAMQAMQAGRDAR